jgi:hypothetical protein
MAEIGEKLAQEFCHMLPFSGVDRPFQGTDRNFPIFE